MNLAMQRYEAWRRQPGLDETLAKELLAMEGDAEKITDSFGCDLAFGTAGLRGVLGAGTNRMNIYTVARATQGLATWLAGSELPQKVAIAYDSRINSVLFSQTAARVLAANGITVYLYPRLEPTPALSFAVRYYGCGAGINVTASHNPAQYNGYKVYGADGCQIGPETADAVLAIIEQLDYFTSPKFADFEEAKREGKIIEIPDSCLEAFVDAVYAQRVGGGEGIENLKLVYTPLNGAGLECIRMLAKKLGVKNMTVVPEQEQPDGNFPTCPYPNPEIRQAMQKGLGALREGKARPVTWHRPGLRPLRHGRSRPQGRLPAHFRQRNGCDPARLYLQEPHRKRPYARKARSRDDDRFDRYGRRRGRALRCGAPARAHGL